MLLPLEKRISSITKEYNFFANKLNNNLPVLNYFRKIKAFAMRNRFVIKSGGSLHVRKLNFRKIKYKSYHKVNYLSSKFKKFFKYNSLVNQQLLMHYKRPTRNLTIRSFRQFEFLEQNAVKKEKLYMYKTFFFNFFRFSSTDQPIFFKTRPAFLSRNRLLNLKHYVVGQKSFLYNYGLSYRKYLKKNLRKTKISFRRWKKSTLRQRMQRIFKRPFSRHEYVFDREQIHKRNYVKGLSKINSYENIIRRFDKKLSGIIATRFLLKYQYDANRWKNVHREIWKYSHDLKNKFYKKLYLALFIITFELKSIKRIRRNTVKKLSSIFYRLFKKNQLTRLLPVIKRIFKKNRPVKSLHVIEKLFHLYSRKRDAISMITLNRYVRNVLTNDLWLLHKSNTFKARKDFFILYSMHFKNVSKQRYVLDLLDLYKKAMNLIIRITFLLCSVKQQNIKAYSKLVPLLNVMPSKHKTDILRKIKFSDISLRKILFSFNTMYLDLEKQHNVLYFWYKNLVKIISFSSYNLIKKSNPHLLRRYKNRLSFMKHKAKLKFYTNYVYKIKNLNTYASRQVNIFHRKFRRFFKFSFKRKFKKKRKYKYQRKMFKSRWFLLKKKLRFLFEGKSLSENYAGIDDISMLIGVYYNYLNDRLSFILPKLAYYKSKKFRFLLKFYLMTFTKYLYKSQVYAKSENQLSMKHWLIRLKLNYNNINKN